MTVGERFHARLGGRPFVGVVHLPPSLGLSDFPGRDEALARVERDVAALLDGGCDGVMLENENDDASALTVTRAQVAWLAHVASRIRVMCDRPLGLNVQRIDWEAALAIAASVGLDMVRLDVFVDRVTMADQPVSVDPESVLRARARWGADDVLLLTDVHVKHADMVGAGSVSRSARRARDAGSDAVIVTGTRTGEPPTVDDLADAREGAHPLPVLVGSGLDARNARALARGASGALVGTALVRAGRIDPGRVERVVGAFRGSTSEE